MKNTILKHLQSNSFTLLYDLKNENLHSNKIKLATEFLSYIGEKQPLSFSHFGKNLFFSGHGLLDNILSHARQMDVFEQNNCKQTLLNQLIEKSSNIHLKNLYNKIDHLDHKISECDQEIVDLATCIAAILSPAQVLIFNRNEKELSQELFQMIKQALIFEKVTNQRSVLIFSHNSQKWFDSITHTVTKQEYQYFFKEVQKDATYADDKKLPPTNVQQHKNNLKLVS